MPLKQGLDGVCGELHDILWSSSIQVPVFQGWRLSESLTCLPYLMLFLIVSDVMETNIRVVRRSGYFFLLAPTSARQTSMLSFKLY
jgi:hypothetical protein